MTFIIIQIELETQVSWLEAQERLKRELEEDEMNQLKDAKLFYEETLDRMNKEEQQLKRDRDT